MHHEQRRDYGQVADSIDEETPSFTDRCDHNTRDSRADQSRAIHHRGVDGDGITEVVAVFDHLHQEGLARRHVEGVYQALQNGESDDF